MVPKSELKSAEVKNIFDVVFLFLCWTNDSTVLSPHKAVIGANYFAHNLVSLGPFELIF